MDDSSDSTSSDAGQLPEDDDDNVAPDNPTALSAANSIELVFNNAADEPTKNGASQLDGNNEANNHLPPTNALNLQKVTSISYDGGLANAMKRSAKFIFFFSFTKSVSKIKNSQKK